jgi:hypothetical protein
MTTTQSSVPEDFDRVTTEDPTAPSAAPSNLRTIPGNDEVERRRIGQERLTAFRGDLTSILDVQLSTTQRLERLLTLQVQVLPALMEDLLLGAQDETRSIVASRTMQAMRDMASIITKKHDVENEDTFNARSPKLRAVFGWLIELFHDILIKHTDDEIFISNVFGDFANQLAGWEDRTERKLKGIPTRLLNEIENPFIADFYEKIKAADKELPKA